MYAGVGPDRRYLGISEFASWVFGAPQRTAAMASLSDHVRNVVGAVPEEEVGGINADRIIAVMAHKLSCGGLFAV